MCDCGNRCKMKTRLEYLGKMEELIGMMTYELPFHEFEKIKNEILLYIDQLREI